VWVDSFSHAALPLFGIGGWFVPASDPVARARVFGLLVIYVASGMGLLLATSFLGLRRYLRQRKLEMPMEMTTTWILVGIVMIIAMLVAATILPRTSREYSLSQLPFTVTSAVRRASRFAMGKEGTRDDASKSAETTNAKEGQATKREGGKRSGKNEQADRQSDSSGRSGQQQQTGKNDSSDEQGGGQGKGSGGSGKSQSSGGDSKSAKGDGSKADKSNDEGKSKGRNAESSSKDKSSDDSQPPDGPNEQSRSEQQKPSRDSSGNSRPNDSQPDASQPQSQGRWSASQFVSNFTSFLGQAFFTAMQWLFSLGLLIAAAIAAWVYREELRAAWQKLLAELREMWAACFGRKPAPQEAPAAPEAPPPPRPFTAFADPFLSGNASRMQWPQLVRYTFVALEAWGREQGCSRRLGQTAQEYAVALGATEPAVSRHVAVLAAYYNQLAYAPRSGASGSPELLRELWHLLRTRQAIATPA
jgi:hypothetical protein